MSHRRGGRPPTRHDGQVSGPRSHRPRAALTARFGSETIALKRIELVTFDESKNAGTVRLSDGSKRTFYNGIPEAVTQSDSFLELGENYLVNMAQIHEIKPYNGPNPYKLGPQGNDALIVFRRFQGSNDGDIIKKGGILIDDVTPEALAELKECLDKYKQAHSQSH